MLKKFSRLPDDSLKNQISLQYRNDTMPASSNTTGMYEVAWRRMETFKIRFGPAWCHSANFK